MEENFLPMDRRALCSQGKFSSPEKGLRIGDHTKNEFRYRSSRNHSDDDFFIERTVTTKVLDMGLAPSFIY